MVRGCSQFLVAAGICLAIGLNALAAEVRVSAAISLKETVEAAAKPFEAKTGDHVQFTFGSSGALLAQIKNGAPVDVFISAADKQMDNLQEAKKIDPATRRVVALNALVLVTPAGAKNRPAAFSDLAKAAYQKIAIGEPRTVPAGQYAVETLKHLNLWDTLSPRLVYGGNVRQVLVYVERGEVDAGIVYSTDAKEAGEKVTITATADAADHSPIEYPGAVVAGAAHAAAGKAFLDFLGTAAGQQVFTAHGFTVPAAAH